jgi:hypothetical protein
MNNEALSPSDLQHDATKALGPMQMQTAPPVPSPLPGTPAALLQIALSQGADIDKLERLMDMQERWEANEARKAYVRAMAGMKSTIPIEIFKRKKVDVPGGAKFKHAELADVVDASVEAMGKFGFTHRWITEQNEGIKVTCVITHEQGHTESCFLIAAPDDSGKKNAIQQVGSTVTYLERYTLMAALGVAAKNQDDDGNTSKAPQAVPDAPEGYDDWEADMTAIAEEGEARFTKTFAGSKEEFRRYATKYRADWWATTKRKASRVRA